jgi:hypothetical protein
MQGRDGTVLNFDKKKDVRYHKTDVLLAYAYFMLTQTWSILLLQNLETKSKQTKRSFLFGTWYRTGETTVPYLSVKISTVVYDVFSLYYYKKLT